MKAMIVNISDDKVVLNCSDGRTRAYKTMRLRYGDAEAGDHVIMRKGENGVEIYYDDSDTYGNGNTAESSSGTAILVLSIVGIFFIPCAIIALVMAIREEKKGYKDDSKVKVGKILSIILIILWVGGLLITLIAGAGILSLYNGLIKNVPDNTTMNIISLISTRI